MPINAADLAALKSFDVLEAYCETRLAPMKRKGSKLACSCPWGAHTKPYHLVLATGDHGTGVCYCHACGRGGTVIDVAAAVEGLDPRAEYAEVLSRVATAAGYNFDAARNVEKRKRAGTGKMPTEGTLKANPAPFDIQLWWSHEDEAIAWEFVDNAAKNRDAMTVIEHELGLPLGHLWAYHTTPTDGLDACGLVGLDDLGRLLYVYTMRDNAGKPHPVMVKLRGRSGGHNPTLTIEGGQLRMGREMQGRFCSLKKGGVPCLYGADAIATHNHIILTEGESDKLAIDASIAALREAHQTGIESPDEYLPEENIPAAVAIAGAGRVKPEWLDALRGRAVTVAADADDAGRRGAEKTLEALRQAGIEPLSLWHPDKASADGGKKDARALLEAGNAIKLILAILTQKRKWTN